MQSRAFVELALTELSCTQNELARQLKVSPTQITKWKQGEHMSSDMKEKLRELLKIGEKLPEFVMWAGSLEAATKWENLIRLLAEHAEEHSETGYDTPPLIDELELLCWNTFDTLRKMGVALPRQFPSVLDIDFEAEEEELWDRIDEDPIASLIAKIFESFTNVYGFYQAYVYSLIVDDELGFDDDETENIEPCLLDLAASKLDSDIGEIATRFKDFQYEVNSEYTKWLNTLKDKAFRAGAPLRAELLNMVNQSNDELGFEAERQALGLNASRLHPDVYMDEILRGMRIIHQVLPAIMKKLGMDGQDFSLDTSELHLQ